jgi:ribosomal protein L32
MKKCGQDTEHTRGNRGAKGKGYKKKRRAEWARKEGTSSVCKETERIKLANVVHTHRDRSEVTIERPRLWRVFLVDIVELAS